MDDLTEYWRTRLDDGAIFVPWEDAHRSCWRCGDADSLQRCHLVPESRGGTTDPSNLVRLCLRCHREQPNVDDPAMTWAWLRGTQHSGALRRFEEWVDAYERMFGEEPGRHGGDPAAIAGRLKAELDAAVRHWGEPGLNAATMAACVRRAELSGLPA